MASTTSGNSKRSQPVSRLMKDLMSKFEKQEDFEVPAKPLKTRKNNDEERIKEKTTKEETTEEETTKEETSEEVITEKETPERETLKEEIAEEERPEEEVAEEEIPEEETPEEETLKEEIAEEERPEEEVAEEEIPEEETSEEETSEEETSEEETSEQEDCSSPGQGIEMKSQEPSFIQLTNPLSQRFSGIRITRAMFSSDPCMHSRPFTQRIQPPEEEPPEEEPPEEEPPEEEPPEEEPPEEEPPDADVTNSNQVDAQFSDDDSIYSDDQSLIIPVLNLKREEYCTRPMSFLEHNDSTRTTSTVKRAITVVGTVECIISKISQHHSSQHGPGKFLDDVNCSCAHRLSLLMQLKVLSKTRRLLKSEIMCCSSDVGTYSDLAIADESFAKERDTLSQAFDSMIKLKSHNMEAMHALSQLYLESYPRDSVPTEGDVVMDFNKHLEKIVFA